MDKLNNVLIVGLGLIGGSLAKCIRQEFPDIRLTGISHRAETVATALEEQIIDEVGGDFASAAARADVIILSTPVSVTLTYISELADCRLKKDVIVTDVGSTKTAIMNAAEILREKDITFIGGHPMAGSHKSGIMAADVDLFENAYYLLTPVSDAQQPACRLLQHLLRGTRSKFLTVTAQAHDQMTGMLSHLPHIIASALVNQSDDFITRFPLARRLAAGGFRDITRIASSDPTMWTDILMSNRKPLLAHLSDWQHRMTHIHAWLEKGDREAIFDFFSAAKETRDGLPVHKEGAIPAFHDLYVNVPDYPGSIAEVTGILAVENISLINLKILETREDIFGILQLTFKNKKDVERAKQAIDSQSSFTSFEK